MRALRFIEVGRVEWQEVPDARVIAADDVVVRPLAVARCDLDPQIVLGRYPMRAPIAMGHECVGEVVECGEEVKRWQPGGRVIVPFPTVLRSVSCVPARAVERVRPGSARCGVRAGLPRRARSGRCAG